MIRDYFKDVVVLISRKFRKITIDDIRFGKLIWEHELEWFSGKVNLFSRNVNLHISSRNSPPVISDKSREAFNIISQSEEKILQKASDDLLAIFNENWNNEGTINSSAFQNRLILEAIILYPDGEAEIYYNDGNMFLGHTVIVKMSEDGKFTEAGIAG
ncbi:MAG: DUF2262 domain-containing protein [Anaerolineae bacterium]|nr:DUF2262 domain-containing protein [Anaerolineae bacterium]